MIDKTEQIHDLAEKIRESDIQHPVEEILQTSERVLKRITDGIYRQPSSALRELISNSYDADATKVIIETDSPRFNRMTIRDNGNGFTEEALASLICSIGGSPKRTYSGSSMGVTNKNNSDLSPGGRRLIGKIGIGLFAVAQLTKEFKIITKTKGSDHHLIAHVILHAHSEEDVKTGVKYETGKSRIWKQKADDKKSQGTEIILLNLLPKTKNELSSKDRWLQSQDNFILDEGDKPLSPPKYHIGCVLKSDENKIYKKPSLPWVNSDSSMKKFEKMIKAVIDETGLSAQNPKLEDLLDNYLKLLWTLGLQVPVPYIKNHPFEINGNDNIFVYRVGNNSNSKAEKIELAKRETIAQKIGMEAVGLEKIAGKFDVFVDDIQLFRPLLFNNEHLSEHTIKNSLIFVGKDNANLNNIPKEMRGGELAFEAYLFWQPKVVPVEHRGVLIRINNSNGTLFDETFMKYPISEQTRKNQITAEIYVHEGMDAALNIDRESFNYSHPHYQYLTKWLYNAFRQFATAHKSLGQAKRQDRLLLDASKKSNKLEALVSEKIKCIKSAIDEPIKIEIIREPCVNISSERKKGRFVYKADSILPSPSSKRTTDRKLLDGLFLEKKIKAIAEILASYGVFDNMPFESQEGLLKAIAEILDFEE